MRFKSVNSMWISLVLLAAIAMPGYSQVKIEDLGYHQEKPLEPGGNIEMQESDDEEDGQAALGEGFIIFKFKVTDIDPIADDSSDIRIDCILIENLGTATGGGEVLSGGTTGSDFVDAEDIIQVMIMDQDSNSLDAPQEPSTPGDGTGNCEDNIFQETNDPGNAQIAWEVFFDTDFVIPDDGSEIFQVAVRVNDTEELEDGSQNHTLLLRATLQIEEIVGSPPASTLFLVRVTDSSAEVIWNGGINSFTDDTYVIDPIMPGETGVVSRFTICDYDANEHQLIINRFFLKQDEGGTALSSDINSFDLYRVEGFTRTLVATRTPNADFDRSSGAPEGMPLPGTDSFDDTTSDPRFALTIPDDTCVTFELEAQISQFAFKGHTIKPRIQISTEEPRSTPIDNTVNPEIVTGEMTLIGKGLLTIPDARLIGKPGVIPINVEGVQLPGFGTLQVGPQGKLQYNPNVIQIKSITGMAPYLVDAVEIDNRRGEARFTVRIDPLAGNPFLTAIQKGAIAYISIEPIGDPGRMSRWTLTYDCFELVAQMNCMPVGFPFPGTPNQNPGNDVSVSTGKVTLVFPGDVDLDGKPTITDTLKVATAILSCINGSGGVLPSPSQTPSVTANTNKTIMVELTDEQKSIADVAAPFALGNLIPTCNELTSADVAEIARLAINFGSMPAPRPTAAGTNAQVKPWYGFFSDVWAWLTGSQSSVSQAQVNLEFNTATQTIDIDVNDVPNAGLGGMQGRILFDPATLRVRSVQGVNGYDVVAANIDNLLGEIRFMAIAPKGQGIRAGQILRLQVNTTDETIAPTLAIEFLVDENGADIAFEINEERGFATTPIALSLNDVQALSQGNGSYRFQAQGTGIADIQVRVYDLAGSKLFDRQETGNTLLFHPLNDVGRRLANGVYMYVITVRGYHRETLRSEVKKLVILR